MLFVSLTEPSSFSARSRVFRCALPLLYSIRWLLPLLLTFSAVIQSQTITVDRQMRRYNVPRLSFINKMDRCEAFLLHRVGKPLT